MKAQMYDISKLSYEDRIRVEAEISKFNMKHHQASARYWFRRTGRVPKLENIHDLFKLHYAPTYFPDFFQDIKRADDPVLTTTSNFLNVIYGLDLWNQLDLTQVTWRMMPAVMWYGRGQRLVTSRHAVAPEVAENGAIPDTDQFGVKVSQSAPKTIIHSFDASLQAILESQYDDTYGNPIEAQKPLIELEHGKDINGAFWQDFDTLAGNSVESIDRLTSTVAGRTAVSYTAGDEDIFGIDKSVDTDLDVAYMDHNSGTDRDFSLKLLDDALKSVRRFWVNSPGAQPVWITGEDTYERWNRELAAQQRFDSGEKVKFTAGGIDGLKYDPTGNQQGGFALRSYREWNNKPIPIVVDPDVPQDTLSRVYLILLGPNATHKRILLPTTYFENGMSEDNPFLLNKLNTESAFVTMMELGCRNFPANAQIRDLQ